MPLIGSGFLARQFRSIQNDHPATLIVAAGVSDSRCNDAQSFAREAALVEESVATCSHNGWLIVYFSSSGSTPGQYLGNIREDKPAVPTTPYGRNKLAIENRIRESGAKYLILRLSNLVGRNQRPWQLVPALADRVLSGSVEIWRGAHRDLMDVDDAVAITDMLLRSGVSGQILNVASGVSVPVEQIVDHLARRLTSRICKQYVDRPDSYDVPIAKLKEVVGNLDNFCFDKSYYQRVINKYYGAPD